MERTLVIIKPDGVRRHLVGSIIQRFEAKGLAIAEMKFETMTPELAKEHYQHLTERSFFDELIDYMTSGPVVYLVLVGEEVIDIVRKMVGATKKLPMLFQVRSEETTRCRGLKTSFTLLIPVMLR